ncbi:MAG: MBL fold metallo-hydrolase [Bacillota bacterium]
MPVKSKNLDKITDDVYVFRNDDRQIPQPAIGIIMTAEGTVLIDAGNGPDHARKIKQQLRKLDAPPVKFVIFTHHHWDHVFGAQEYEGAVFISSQLCYEELYAYSQIPWSRELLLESMERNPEYEQPHRAKLEAVSNWDDFEIMVPDISFNEELYLNFPDRQLHLQYVGGSHSEDSIIIKDLTAKVMFLGDAFYSPPRYKEDYDETSRWSFLAELLDEEIETYVHSHGNKLSRQAVKRLIKRHQQ